MKSKEAILEVYLHEQIPLSAAMGIKVDLASSEKIILSAPISNNINHKQTVFGGSLHAIATLACWSLLHVNVKDAQIVIASSEIRYVAPVDTDFKVECCKPSIMEWERFEKNFLKWGKAHLKLNARIFQGETLCVDYSGVFVAKK